MLPLVTDRSATRAVREAGPVGPQSPGGPGAVLPVSVRAFAVLFFTFFTPNPVQLSHENGRQSFCCVRREKCF